MEITPVQQKVLGHLLRLAADEFGNHGCNDLRLRKDVKLTEDEAFEFLTEMRKWDGDPEAREPKRAPEMYSIDWMAMRMFAEKVDPQPTK